MIPTEPARRAACARAAVFMFALAAPLAFSQTAPTPADPTPSGKNSVDETIVLSPFTVNTDKDVGFVAANSLAGGRLAGALAETPVAYSVQTREFLDALNITDLNEAIEWTVNATTTPDDGGGQLFGGTGSTSIRGVGSNGLERDFFAGGHNPGTYNLERMDYARGPNAILFGVGSIGGTPNAVLKRARVNWARTQLKLQIGSWGSFDSSFDVNRTLGKKFAIRVNATKQDLNDWRDSWNKKRIGFSPSLTFEPTHSTRIMVNAEYYNQQATAGMNSLTDQVSGWDGKTVFSGPQAFNSKGYAGGVSRFGTNTYIWAPATGSGYNTIMSYTGMMQTQGYSGQHPINGVTPLSTSNLNYSGAPILDEPASPGGLFDLAAQNSAFHIPKRSFTNIGPEPTSINRFRDVNFAVEQQVGDPLSLQLSGDINREYNYGLIDWYSNQGYPNVYIDINKLNPDGTPNAEFLQPYDQFNKQERQKTDTKNKALRLAAALVKDTRWVGIKANIMAAAEQQEAFKSREYFVLPADSDPRQWGLLHSPNFRTIQYRYYWNQPQREVPNFPQVTVVDPALGTSTTYHPMWVLASDRADATILNRSYQSYYQASANLSFFNKHLILLGAFRQDSVTRSQKQFMAAMDEPAGTVLTRNNFFYRPNPPADYWNLTYVPKNAAGKPTAGAQQAINRPRDSYGVALPQYANDRFQSDYNPPATKTRKPTKELGGIVNVGHGFSLWANYSQTFNPALLGAVTIDYGTPSASTSNGVDYGVRYSMGSKFYATLSRYQSTEDNQTVAHPSGYADINTIIDTPTLNDSNSGDINIEGLGETPQAYQDKIDRQSHGYEFEMVANLRPNWRLTANYAWADAVQLNAYRLTRSYLARNDATLRKILDDAGVAIDANNVASIKPGIAVSSDYTSIINKAVSAWNDLQSNEANWVTGAQKLTRLTRYTANFFTDYRIVDGGLRGLRFGFGMQFRGPQVIGYRGSDTIVDPNNPTKAIDDPTVSAYTPYWQKAYYLATGTIGYSMKLSGGHTVDFNLSVSNLFNYTLPLYNGTALHPVNGDLSSPARATYARAYSYTLPRSFRFSTSLSF